MIKELLVILISSSLVNNVVLSQFLGLCPFLGVSKKTETATGMGVSVIFVITLASAVAGVIYKYILVPFDITYLQTIVFILVIAALVQFASGIYPCGLRPLEQTACFPSGCPGMKRMCIPCFAMGRRGRW